MPAKVTSSGEYSNSLLKLIFNATAFANMADNAATSPFVNLFVSLHTATPGANGSQTTAEAAYTGYARVAVTRASAGWTITGNSVSPAATITFPSASGGSETETFFGIGTSTTGAGHLIYFGQIAPQIVVANGVQPLLTSASAVTEV